MKRVLISVTAFLVVLSVVSCRPLGASAAEISTGEQSQIYNYLDSSGENLSQIDFQMDTDADGKRSVRLQLYTLQKAALESQSNFYDTIDFSVAPDTGSVSGSASSGLYVSRLDGKTHSVTYTPVTVENSSFPIGVESAYSSDEFTISINYNSGQNAAALKIVPYSDGSKLGYNLSSTGAIYSLSLIVSGGSYFNTFTSTSSPTRYPGFQFTNTTPPTLPANLLQNIGGYTAIAGNSVSVSLPPGNYDSSRPWDYYNDTLLPYIQEHFPNMEEYTVFPDGYEPPAQPTTIPTEYPTLPGYDMAMETATTVNDEVGYVMPEIPTKPVPVPVFDFNSLNSYEIMAPVGDALSGIWALITDVLTEYDLFPYVGIAVFTAIVAVCMSLGR